MIKKLNVFFIFCAALIPNYYQSYPSFLDDLHQEPIEEQSEENSERLITEEEYLEVFNVLKKRLNVPTVKLCILPKDECFYSIYHDSIQNRIVLSREIVDLLVTMCPSSMDVKSNITPSRIIAFLIHELTHAQQFLNEGSAFPAPSVYRELFNMFKVFYNLQKSDDFKYSWYFEQSADAGAAGTISCHLCLANVKKHAFEKNSVNHERGYFCNEDYGLYIQSAKNEGLLCDAHKNCNSKDTVPSEIKLKDYLPKPWPQ